ncbi:MAG: T9SS type A sorting domain-containing protein [Candidatus Kariarchaeaceae archaeon]
MMKTFQYTFVKNIIDYTLLFLLLIFTNSYAQFTHTFTQISHIDDGGDAQDVAISVDGTVFLANGMDGLLAYGYDGESFSFTAQVPIDSGFSIDVALGSDSTVYVANGVAGLQAYKFNGHLFSKIAHFDNGGFANGVAVNNEKVVFLANQWPVEFDGLFALNLKDSSFSIINHIDVQGGSNQIALGLDGTVYLAHGMAYGYGGTSFTAFTFNDSSFIDKAHIDGGFAHYVALGPNGSVFLSYTGYGGSTYYYPDDGIRAFIYDGDSLIYRAYINDEGMAHGITVGPDGTIFLANGDDGLRAYRFNGDSLINTAHMPIDSGFAWGVTVGTNGTIFLANGNGGLFAYNYSASTNIVDGVSNIPNKIFLSQNYPNPFNPSTTIEFTLPKSDFTTLKVYNILGKEVSTLVSNKLNSGNHTYTFDGKNLASGIYYYQLVAGDYREIKKMVQIK